MEGTWKPFGFVNEQGELAGFDVDVIKAISERIKDDNIKIQIEKITKKILTPAEMPLKQKVKNLLCQNTPQI